MACTLLILVSLSVQAGVAILETGYNLAAYATPGIGFNEPFTWGTVRIIASYVTLAELLGTLIWYPLLGVVCHVVALVLIWSSRLRRGIRQCFFAIQALMFPLWAIPPFIAWIIASLFQVPDGESIQDGPLNVALVSQIWGLISLIILFLDMIHEKLTQERNDRSLKAVGVSVCYE